MLPLDWISNFKFVFLIPLQNLCVNLPAIWLVIKLLIQKTLSLLYLSGLYSGTFKLRSVNLLFFILLNSYNWTRVMKDPNGQSVWFIRNALNCQSAGLGIQIMPSGFSAFVNRLKDFNQIQDTKTCISLSNFIHRETLYFSENHFLL